MLDKDNDAMIAAAQRFAQGLKRAQAPLAALALCVLLTACADTDVEGAANYVGSMGGMLAHSPPARPSVVQIFIASTRKGESGAAAQQVSTEGTRYALTTLTFPPGHKAGEIERPMWGSGNAASHVVVAGRRELDADEFRGELASHISGRIGVNRDILVFVHGFNTSFEEARWRAGQIAADSRFGGVPILFTWPTRGGLLSYASDKDSATASRDAFEELLQNLAKTPGLGRIHILAHSMGCWLTMEALREIAISGNRDLGGHLGEIMLAAPDIDMDVFAGQMARIAPADVTVFATANDRALSLSSWIADARPRVGAIDPAKPRDRAALEKLGAKVYDLSSFSDGFVSVSHGLYADTPDVIHAIGAQLASPRAQEVNTVSVIDATGSDGAANPPTAVAATPAAASPTSPAAASPVVTATPLAPPAQ
jgi:esterase/lipase superfamily enzyme